MREKIRKQSSIFMRALEMGKEFYSLRHYLRQNPPTTRHYTLDEVKKFTFSPSAMIAVLVETGGSQEEADWTIQNSHGELHCIYFKAPTPARIKKMAAEAKALERITKRSTTAPVIPKPTLQDRTDII